MKNVDLCVIGSGLVGLALAASLKPLNLKVLIIDAKDPKHMPDLPDTRTLALSWSTIQFLESLGIWQDLKQHACPIDQVHISEKGSCAIARLTAEDAEVESLGHVTPIIHLHPLLLALAKDSAQILAPAKVKSIDASNSEIELEDGSTIKSKLIIAADGVQSFARKQLGLAVDHTDYQQTALVTSVTLKDAHAKVAYERFLSDGILALLPLTQNRYGVVWTQADSLSEKTYGLSDNDLLTKIQSTFGYRVGKMAKLGARNKYPLHQIIAKQSHVGKVLLLGNAAHNLNPVAAQGFNLCVHDIQKLTALIKSHGLDDSIFEAYDAQVKPVHQKIIQTTDLIAKTYASDNPLTKLARRAAITGINRCSIAKSTFTNMMMGKTKSGANV